MEIYYKSVGYGGVLLLNSTPDTTGLVPSGDVSLYARFGSEIDRRFAKPLYALKDTSGLDFEIKLKYPSPVNHTILMEDYRQGHRIREYVIEGFAANEWKVLAKGTSVGRMKIDPFPAVSVTSVRLRITKSADMPLIRSFAVYNVENYSFVPEAMKTDEWSLCGTWDTKTLIKGTGWQTIDLSPFITKPGQYEVVFTSSVVITGMNITKIEIYFDNDSMTQQSFIRREGNTNTFYINRTAQVSEGSSSVMKVELSSDNKVFQNKAEIRIRERQSK